MSLRSRETAIRTAHPNATGLNSGMCEVSVIIPCKGNARALRTAVQSVRAQSIPCQIIIIDDGSRHSDAVTIAAIADLSHARLIRHDISLGPAAARNAGIEVSRGRYVAFLDADDVWCRGKLALQLKEMKAWQLAFSYMRYGNIGPHGMRAMPVPGRLNKARLLKNTAIGCSSVMVRRDLIGTHRFPDAPVEDLAFWAMLLDDGTTAELVGSEIMVLRRAGGLSRNKVGAAWRYWRTIRKTLGVRLLPALVCFTAYAVRAVLKHWIPVSPPSPQLVLQRTET